MRWDDAIQYLKGVGPKRAEKLARLGVHTLGDLLQLYPRAYVDYSSPVPVAAAPYDAPCTVKAEVLGKSGGVRISGGRTLHKVHCADDTGSLTLVFFNNPYAAERLQTGGEYLFYGRVGGALTAREMLAPSFLPAGGETPLTPVYPLTEGLKNHEVAKPAKAALRALETVPEVLPAGLLEKYKLPMRAEALRMVHAPRNMSEVEAGRRRLVFEELLCLQLGLLLIRGREVAASGAPMRMVDMEPFFAALPFAPTGAQRRAIGELANGLAGKSPANRLVQGDVGSGKTAVAAAGVYLAAQNGYQSVLMAPTEILARQHAETLEKLLAPLGIATMLLTGTVKGAARKATLSAIEAGRVQLVVGTHAVLSGPVSFHRLGFAITDEQHRFGVRQRAALATKAVRPHLLVMSATPIPRTLALLMFGDLDVSVLDELPPGRKPVKTRQAPAEKRADMFGFLAKQIAAGHQAYIVCPLIEEGESDLKAASVYMDEVARPLLPKARVGLVHGRLKPAEKAAVMRAFRAGELDVLVSTTVIEVGVDVPNATVMVIEDAERYGLSALHQLRGRVGRGHGESWCFLVSGHTGEAAKNRLAFLCRHTDGFEVAQYDLETRGPGDFFGNRQHGLPTLRIASLATDTRVMKAAQDEAAALLRADPRLEKPEHAPLAGLVQALFEHGVAMN